MLGSIRSTRKSHSDDRNGGLTGPAAISAQVVLQNIQKINSRVYDGE